MARPAAIQLTHRTAKLSEQFGYDYACRLFGKEAIDSLPRLAAGKNKGQIKGYLIWRTAMVAGWVRECQAPCKAGGLVDAWIGDGQYVDRNNAVRGEWMGRTQNLAGSKSVLTAEYREQSAREEAARLAEIEQMRSRKPNGKFVWEEVA